MPSYRIIINFTAVGMMVDVQSKRLVTWHNARCMLDSPVNEWMSQSDSVTDTSPLPNFFLCVMHPLPNDWHLKYRPVCRFTARLHTVSQKMHQLWNGIVPTAVSQNYKDRFWRYLAKILKIKRHQIRVCMFQFSCRFAFISTFRISNPTPKITPILTLMQTRQHKQGEIFKHSPQIIIFGTRNLQTFKNNTLINTANAVFVH